MSADALAVSISASTILPNMSVAELRRRFERGCIVGAEAECWLWRGYKDRKGYGVVRKGRRPGRGAHRVAYVLWVGEIRDRLCVCHHCDTPLCVNPRHLFLGTAQENNADMMRKGRYRNPWLRGEKVGGSKLSEADVKETLRLLALGESKRVIAKRYGVVPGAIHNIASGLTWKHLKRANAEPTP